MNSSSAPLEPADALECARRALQRQGAAPATLRAVLGAGRALLAHVDVPLASVEPAHVRALVAAYRDRGPATQAALRVRLRMFFRALVSTGALERDPSACLELRRPEIPPQLCPAREQVAALLCAASDVLRYRRQRPELAAALALRDRACLELLYALGLRRSEAAAARVQDLRLADGSLVVRRAKRGQCRALPLPRPSLVALREYLAQGRPVLAGRWKEPGDHLLLAWSGGPLGGPGVGRVVARVAAAAGVLARPHALRRAVATQLVEAGATVEAVRQLLGHADLSTTARYVQLGRDELRRVVEALDLGDAD